MQHITFVQDDGVVNWHLDLRADNAVQEAALIGQTQMRQTLTDHAVVFHHNLFGDDTQVEQVTVEHLFTFAKARVKARMAIGVTYQRNLIANLQHRIPIGAG